MAWRGDSEVHNREIEMKRTVRERERERALSGFEI
jgi:hypothetical protein